MRIDRPGYTSRRNKDGTLVRYWSPQRAVAGASPKLQSFRFPDDMTDEQVAAECRRRTDELMAEVRSLGVPPKYDGTLGSLIKIYRFDKTSSIHKVKHSTRIRDYEPSLRVLAESVGARRIDVLKRSDFVRWYDGWWRKGQRRAAGAMKLLRIVLSYGTGERLPGCAVAREILSDMRFEQPKPRTVAMTYEQCLAIVRQSAKSGYPSIGFVEALKFETALRRIDVIGEWTPSPDGGPFRWQGLTTKNLKDGILTLNTSKTGAPVTRDLKTLPLVVEALKAYRIPDIGPIVVSEDTGRPWWEARYTPRFREIRNAAGVPSTVWSMDTRAGAVTETVDAMGSIEAARELATHTTTKMTKRYSRGDGLEQSRKIAEARVAARTSKAE